MRMQWGVGGEVEHFCVRKKKSIGHLQHVLHVVLHFVVHILAFLIVLFKILCVIVQVFDVLYFSTVHYL